MRDPYKELANAIVLKAVRDYRMARKKGKSREAKLMIKDCERFFRSEWFTMLTDVDGQMLLQRLQEESIS